MFGKFIISSFLFFGLFDCFSQDSLQFTFFLYDGLEYEDVAGIKENLDRNGNRIARDFNLNVSELGKFEVHVWQNRQNFVDATAEITGQRIEAANGRLGYSAVYIFFNKDQNAINQSEFPYCLMPAEIAEHELAHSLSLRLNLTFPNNPRWFWESVAIYESNEFYDPNTLGYLKSGNFPTLAELDQPFGLNNLKIYQVGYLIGEFIIETWGKSKYIRMIKNNGNIRQALNIGEVEFEEMWKSFVMNKYFKSTSAFESHYSERSIQLSGGMLKINHGEVSSLPSEVRIFNLTGQQVYSCSVNSSLQNINISDFQKGIYLITLFDGSQLIERRKIFIN